MEYIILYGETPDILSKKVKEHITLNWRPKGGVAVATIAEKISSDGHYTNAVAFYQAMWRDNPPIIISSLGIYS
jgi:hypothetical protein